MNIAGVRVDDITWNELIEKIKDAVIKEELITISYLNIHVWNMAQKNENLKKFLEMADYVYCDGKGIQLGAKVLGRRIRERYTGAFFIDDFAEEASKHGWRIFVVGGKEGVAKKACEVLMEKFPGFQCSGFHHGYIKGMGEKVIKLVNSSKPDILFVGMGTPLQEEFVLNYREKIDVPVVWCVGALFDFVAGVQPKPPEWMSRSGLEWLHRLLSNPKRLWKRYLIGNTIFLFEVAKERIFRGRWE